MPLRSRRYVLAVTIDLGVLISGTGTNLGAILDAIRVGELDARVRLVVSNRAGAKGLLRAEEHGVPTLVLSHKSFPDRESFDAELAGLVGIEPSFLPWYVIVGMVAVGIILGTLAALLGLRRLVTV